MKKQNTVRLLTPWSRQPEVPWNEYPRPQLRRESFFCLNGQWDLSRNGESWGKILVPYPPESTLSGIMRPVGEGDVLVYERGFVLPEGFNRGKVLLHFGAVDQKCRVWLNDRFVGEHEGGYLPFFFDVTQYLQAENRLRVEAEDPLDHDYPWGKQCRKRVKVSPNTMRPIARELGEAVEGQAVL